jgi:putative FmdB family regulatory protein
MPVYEYRCEKGHTFEVTQSINDPSLTKCEKCGRPVERVLHSPAVHFKGSGFYNTDYGTKKRQREKSSAESGSSESRAEAPAGDSKPSSGESGAAGSDSKTSSEKPKPAPKSE